jgi:hypothetical protein
LTEICELIGIICAAWKSAWDDMVWEGIRIEREKVKDGLVRKVECGEGEKMEEEGRRGWR